MTLADVILLCTALVAAAGLRWLWNRRHPPRYSSRFGWDYCEAEDCDERHNPWHTHDTRSAE